MSYDRQSWVDGESGGTPLSAARLAHMETGIGNAADEIAGRLSDAALKAAFVPFAPQFHGVRYYAYGHSFGQVQAPANAWAGSLYPARLRDLLHADSALYANRTISGASMDAIVTDLNGSWTPGTYGLVSLLGNQNSAGNGQTQAAFKTQVRAFLNHLFSGVEFPPTVLIIKDTTCTSVGYARYGGGTYNDATVAAFNGYLMDVIAEYPGAPIVVADPIADGWNAATMTCPDGQHPNDRGQAHIAASCLKALAAAPYREGLNLGITAPTAYAADNFNRVDGPVGSTPTGGFAWTPTAMSGTVTWATSGSHLAGATAGGEGLLLIDDGHADGTLSATYLGGDGGLVFRAVSATNFIMLWVNGGTWTLIRQNSGYAVLAGGLAAAANGDVVQVVLAGSTVTVKVNGTQVYTGTQAINTTATKHGLRVADAGGAWDDFSHTA